MQVSSKTDRLKDLDFSTRLLGSNPSRSNIGSDPDLSNRFASPLANNGDHPSPEAGKDLPLKDLVIIVKSPELDYSCC